MGTGTGTIAEYYVVRIYRRDRHSAARATGIVEGAGSEGVKVFHNVQELLEGLDFPAGTSIRGRGKKAREKK